LTQIRVSLAIGANEGSLKEHGPGLTPAPHPKPSEVGADVYEDAGDAGAKGGAGADLIASGMLTTLNLSVR
jgi:hypothetical protein